MPIKLHEINILHLEVLEHIIYIWCQYILNKNTDKIPTDFFI